MQDLLLFHSHRHALSFILQLRSVPVKLASEQELDDEAEWIYKQAFMQPTISQQHFQVYFSYLM